MRYPLLGRAVGFGVVILGLCLGVVSPAAADKTADCSAAKMKSAGKATVGQVNCHVVAALKGVAVDQNCLANRTEKLRKDYQKAELKGGDACATVSDADKVVEILRNFRTSQATLLQFEGVGTPDPCGAVAQKAVGSAAGKKLNCLAMAVKNKKDPKPCRDREDMKLASRFNAVESLACPVATLLPFEENETDKHADGVATILPLELPKKYVFQSSVAVTGNMGGIGAADTLCNSLASGRGLPGTYKAWLSNSIVSPSQRFTHSRGPYILVNQDVVALNWNELTRMTGMNIRVPINVNERGASEAAQFVWTGTDVDGTAKPSAGFCGDWTSASGSSLGGVGTSGQQVAGWTTITRQACSTSARIYCFQQ